MTDWEEYKLGELAEVQTGPFGSQLHASDYKERGIPSIMPTNIGNRLEVNLQNIAYISEEDAKRLSRYLLLDRDIVYSRRGDVEKCAYIGPQQSGWLCGTGCIRIRIDANKAFPKFCAYLLSTPDSKSRILNSAVGTTMSNLNSRILSEVPLLLPSVDEQRAIASVLSSLDDKIDLLHRQNKTLEAMAETMFKSWLTQESTENTEVLWLEELVTFDPREKLTDAMEPRYFDMKCLSENSMTIADGVRRQVSSGSYFRNGDTLLAKITPCLENGKTGFVMDLDDGEVARGSTEFIVMRPKKEVSPYFTYCLARSSDFRNNAILSMTGTSGRQRVQTGMLKGYEVRYSPLLMQEFHAGCEPFFSKVHKNQVHIRTLTQMRDTLLPKLMSGETKVKTN